MFSLPLVQNQELGRKKTKSVGHEKLFQDLTGKKIPFDLEPIAFTLDTSTADLLHCLTREIIPDTFTNLLMLSVIVIDKFGHCSLTFVNRKLQQHLVSESYGELLTLFNLQAHCVFLFS